MVVRRVKEAMAAAVVRVGRHDRVEDVSVRFRYLQRVHVHGVTGSRNDTSSASRRTASRTAFQSCVREPTKTTLTHRRLLPPPLLLLLLLLLQLLRRSSAPQTPAARARSRPASTRATGAPPCAKGSRVLFLVFFNYTTKYYIFLLVYTILQISQQWKDLSFPKSWEL